MSFFEGVFVPRLLLLAAVLATLAPCRAQWVNLFNGKNLDGWEVVGDGVWMVMDGVLVGDRIPRKSREQSWLYTKKDFGEYDLSLQYWTRLGGNSGISIRDQTRAKYAAPPDYDRERTPSHNGYEIQISNGYADQYPSGSIYLFDKARVVAQQPGWNTMIIESRNEVIRVRLNGQLVSEHEGDPKRPKTGPIGLQLHDPGSVAMFRNIRIKELRKK